MSSPPRRRFAESSSLPSSPPTTSAAGSSNGNRSGDEDDDAVEDDTLVRSEDETYDPNEIPVDDEEAEDGEDLLEGAERDYREMPALDTYDAGDLDETDYAAMDPTARAAAELRMRKRDRARAQGRVPAAFMDDEESEDEAAAGRLRRRRRVAAGRDADAMDLDERAIQEAPVDNLEDMKGHSLREWVTLTNTRNAIKNQFRHFLQTYLDNEGQPVYAMRIRAMCERNGESLEVSYVHLSHRNSLLTMFLNNAPIEMLAIFDEVAVENTLAMFSDYGRIHSEIHVRITDIPSIDSLRDLRHNHLNCLVRVVGVVTRRTNVLPQLKYVKYDCGKCSFVLGPFYQDTSSELEVGSCPQCQSKGPFSINASQTVYRNYQKLTLQESPGTVPAGRLPRQKEVILLRDLIDAARPGEEIEVIGVYRNNFDSALNTKNGFPVFATIIEANSISKREDQFAAFRLTDDDVKEIMRLSRDPNIVTKVIKSIAPSIYGHRDVKTAIAMSLFGGEAKDVQGKHRIRGDINVLLLGDPGTAKSQFLKYVEKTSHRAIYATGQGASAVGLTASVHRDSVTREWTLEGGALVLADKGVCLIDEFDKMNDADRTSIHEAMEQQSISISKAGIVTTLQARCAVIAAANPVKGKYDASLPFSRNVDLTEPILSRFDVLCVVKDIVDPLQDEMLAEFVVGSHIRHHPEFQASRDIVPDIVSDPDVIPQDLLKKYIMYARENRHPRLQQVDDDRLASLYSELRQQSLSGDSIPVTVRLIESMIRMSEAHARIRLDDFVRQDDVNMAIRICLESFISAQKYSVMRQMRRVFAHYLTYKRDNYELLLFALNAMAKEEINYHLLKHAQQMPETIAIKMDDLAARAKEFGIYDVVPFVESAAFKAQKQLLYRSDRKDILITL